MNYISISLLAWNR